MDDMTSILEITEADRLRVTRRPIGIAPAAVELGKEALPTLSR